MVQQILQKYKSLQDIIAILGMDELNEEDKITVRARAQDRALPGRSRSSSPKSSPARPAKFVDLADTIKGFRGLCEGKYDHLPEQAFYMVGTIAKRAVGKGARSWPPRQA